MRISLFRKEAPGNLPFGTVDTLSGKIQGQARQQLSENDALSTHSLVDGRATASKEGALADSYGSLRGFMVRVSSS